MPFKFSEQLIHDYYTDGLAILRGVTPPTLVEELRRVTDAARRIAYERQLSRPDGSGGGQVQRIQPLGDYADDLDLRSFEEWGQLPEIVDAITRITGKPRRHYMPEQTGVFLDPEERPWTLRWHRDIRDNKSFPLDEWQELYTDMDHGVQLNAALHFDASLWVVPGSHRRPDLPSEADLFPERPIPDPEEMMVGRSHAERERIGVEYAMMMPRAHRVVLDAGDLALYRNTTWHLGTYLSGRPRATIHGRCLDDADRERSARQHKIFKEREAAGIPMENPNAA